MQANIAHITGWEEVTIKSIRAYLGGNGVYMLPEKDIDTHHDEMVRARATITFDEVLHEWEETREFLKGVLTGHSERDLEARITFPWGRRGSIGEMLAIIAVHEGEYTQELEKFN